MMAELEARVAASSTATPTCASSSTPATGARSRPASTSRSSAEDREALREQSRRTQRFELRFTAWHNDVWKPVIAAVNGVCAGGGLHFVADADIVSWRATRRSSIRTSRSARSSVFETIALAKKSPMEAILRMALIGAHERIESAARVPTSSGICSRGRRPARAAPRRGAGLAREDRDDNRPRTRWPRPSARCGASLGDA